jgi:hypothetical protein
MIPHPETTRQRLGRFRDRIQGVNDSEVLFWLIAPIWIDRTTPRRPSEVRSPDLWDDWRSEGAGAPGPYSGLNVGLSHGTDDLWAFCLSRGDHGTGFFAVDSRYYDLVYRADSDRVLVASEPTDLEEGWKPVGNGRYTHADRTASGIQVESGAIPGLKPEDLTGVVIPST